MSGLTLCIGSKNLSSWSLRPWLFLRHHGLPFKEILIPLDQPETRVRLMAHSPSGRVPALYHGDLRVWESIAICEYAAETFALPGAWPLKPAARAFARSVAHEMHSGFADLRRELPFNATRDPAPVTVSAAAQADIERVCTIWREARSRFGWLGDWLFGSFGIADAMFAPVALRFAAYDVPLEATERDYVRCVLAHPAVQQWIEAAAMEVPPPAAQAAHAAADDVREAELPPPWRAKARQNAMPARRAEPEAAPEAAPRVRSFILPPD